TGCEPARHGVVGNNYFDRATRQRITLIGDPVFDKERIVKVPTIYDVAKRAGLRTAGIRWPASRNAPSLDVQVPDTGVRVVLQKYTTPSLLADCREAGLWTDGAAGSTSAPAAPKLSADERWTRVFQLVLSKYRPNLALLHLADVDHVEH